MQHTPSQAPLIHPALMRLILSQVSGQKKRVRSEAFPSTTAALANAVSLMREQYAGGGKG